VPPALSSIIAIHDSLEHKPFRISPKLAGSANGHNGVRSTSAAEALGSPNFRRLRIGIGRGDGDAANFVLEKLGAKELLHWSDPMGEGVEAVWKEVEKIIGQQNPTDIDPACRRLRLDERLPYMKTYNVVGTR